MPVVRTAVLLFAYPAGQQLNLQGDAPWYVQYFFNPAYGLSAFWRKQSDNDIIIAGEVFDWALVDDPNPDLTNRTNVINTAIDAMENNRGANFDNFDLVILVLGIRAGVNADGGSTTASSRNRQHAGIVGRVRGRFDFLAHEIGHAIGLNHSYGNASFKSDTWSQFGEYAHPYCVMSAQAYGGFGGPYFPAVPRDNRSEYTGLGPSVNAATALGRGWLNAHSYNLGSAGPTEFQLRSRHWFGKNPALPPQALEVKASDGKTYVVEYRESAGWDQGQGTAMLFINAGKASTGDIAHPNTFSATYLGLIALPITFGAPGSIYNGPGFGIEVLERDFGAHTVRIRISPWRVNLTSVNLVCSVQTLRAVPIESEQTTFEPGEKLCVEGTWRYTKYANEQVATCDVTYDLARPPIAATWVVEGTTLDRSDDVLTFWKKVKVANAKLDSTERLLEVKVRYEIETLPNGSRLRLFNRPQDHIFSLYITVTLFTSVGSASAEDWIKFNGTEFIYPPEFYQQEQACLDRFRDIGRRYVRYKVVLPPDLWSRVPEERIAEVEQILEVLGYLRQQEDRRAYRQGLAKLANLVGVKSVKPKFVSLTTRARFTPQLHSHPEPEIRSDALTQDATLDKSESS